jgi:diguanylate cyclase (GGDEF)-like protein
LAYLPPPEFNAERTYVIRSSDLVSHADLVMHYPVRLLETIFTPPHLLGASGETFLADAGGYFVTRVRYSSTQGTNAPITSAPMAACLARDDQETLGPDYRGVAVIHGFRHVPELGGACIMAIFGQEEAFAPLVTLRWYLAFVGTVVLLLAFVTATYVSRRTTGPMLALHRAALQFIGGDRDAVADEIGHDEVTDLARSLNLLTRQVATTEKDLERRVERRTKELEEANAKLQTAVEERTAAEEKVREMAFYDSLTDLPNRRLLTERLSRAIVSRSRVRRHAALMFLDLDDFKSVNDTEGHKVGDKLLVKVAKRLRSCVRDTDTVARLGGDEFVILLENLDEARDDAAVEARMIAEKIVSALGESYELAGGSHRVSVSMGIAMFDDPGTTVEAVFSRADAAMYEAKKGGKNGYRFATPVVQLPVGKAG